MSFKVVVSNAEEFASYANKVVEGIDIIYHDTSILPYTLKEALAVQVIGTRKVWMIQRTFVHMRLNYLFMHLQVSQIPLL